MENNKPKMDNVKVVRRETSGIVRVTGVFEKWLKNKHGRTVGELTLKETQELVKEKAKDDLENLEGLKKQAWNRREVEL